MKNDIHIKFEHLGQKYSGHFGIVMGGGHTSTYHLMDNKNFYLGRLRYSDFINGWVFDPSPKNQELKDLAEFFGDYLTNWIE